MPRVEPTVFQRERKKTGEYRWIEGTIKMYIQDGTEAFLTLDADNGSYKGREVEIDASPFIGDIDDGSEGKRATVLVHAGEDGALLGRYISVEKKRGRQECFEGLSIIIAPSD
ncbi:MAG: hypothetical protein V3V26_01085 [Candidatus Aenigmarchaeota archaeon]